MQEKMKVERIPGTDRKCEFCGEPLHYGWCDGLHEAREKAIREGRGRPVPITRAGP